MSFGLENLTFDPNDGDPKRRFSSFWVTGDGNYLQFDGSQDALSTTPTYKYPAVGTYEAAAYLTGKYTNRIPPARAAQSINIVSAGGTSPTPFSTRLGKGAVGNTPMVDIFSNHEIRKKNLTTFVISWPANVNATGVYLFFNGYKNSRTGALQAFPTPPLKYQRTDVPLYFNGRDATGRPFFDATKIKEYSTGNLRSPGFIDGITFGSTFANSMPSKFSHFVYFPAETATQANMPANFLENRLFAVLWADSTFVPQDSFMNFMVMLTGPTPVTGNEQLNAALAQINNDLIPDVPLGTIPQLQQSQYVQAIDELQLQYLTTFDPNQLTVADVKKLGADEYEVTFQLEMCNKGRGIVENEDVSLTFPTSFSNFTPDGFSPVSSNQTTISWDFRVAMTIPGVEVRPDGSHEESVCQSIRFKAKTNCEGLRSLWKSDKVTSVQSCVVFDGGTVNVQPECHAATGIDSTAFGCLCCNASTGNRGDGMDGSCWPLWLLLILVVLFAIWWVYRRNNN